MNASGKRRDETFWQWQSRLQAVRQMERDRDVPLITPELERRGWYATETVMHVETGTRVETKRRRRQSAIEALRDRGQLTNDHVCAAQQIASVAESIRRHVSVRCSSVEARVDCGGSAHSALMERLRQVRLERTFGLWRSRIRVPRAMLIEMIVKDNALKETARSYRVGWPRAMRMLEDALDQWNDIMQVVAREIDERDLEAAHNRLQRAA